MLLRLQQTDFDRHDYDEVADVLYLGAGHPSQAVEFDETPEGHALRVDRDGRLVGITIVNARWLIEHCRSLPSRAAEGDEASSSANRPPNVPSS